MIYKPENNELRNPKKKVIQEADIELEAFKQVNIVSKENILFDSIQDIYISNNKQKTWKHVQEVAKTAAWLADKYSLDAEKVRIASMLHDVSAIMSPQEMYDMAITRNMLIDPAEDKYYFLLHQRISRIIAEERFDVKDEDILSAIECHTTLKKNSNLYDKTVFIADKISWDQEGNPPYYEELKMLATESLYDACYFYIDYQFSNNLLLMPHRWIVEAYEELKRSR